MTEFLIIGGGINGLLLARELAATQASVLLLEKGECFKEASWAGGGIVSPLYPWRYGSAVTALSNWAQDFYPELANTLKIETKIDPEFNRTGLLMLDAVDESLALQWAVDNRQHVERVDRQFIYHLEPKLGAGFSSGLWMPDVANIRNPRLGKALIADLERRPNVTIIEKCQVTSFEVSGDRIVAVETQNSKQKRFVGEKIILSTGAWSALLTQKLGVDLSVEPVKGQMLLYKLDRPPVHSIVLSNGRYVIPRQDGYLLVGSTLEYEEYDKTPTVEALVSLKASGQQLVPELISLDPVNQWAGLRPGAPNGIPFIGRVPGFENIYVNAGQFRNGLVLAPASARLMADILLDRKPIIDPAPYEPGAR